MLPKTGIGFYLPHLLFELIKIAPENDYHLCDILWGQSFYNLIKLNKDLSNISDSLHNISNIPFPFQPILRMALFLYNKVLREAGKIEEMDLFFGPNFKGFFKGRLRNVVTIHDMAHEYYPEDVEPKVLRYLTIELPRSAERATLIIADSQNTKKDILKFLDVPDQKVKVIHIGVDQTFRPIKDAVVLEPTTRRYHLPKKFMLYFRSNSAEEKHRWAHSSVQHPG